MKEKDCIFQRYEDDAQKLRANFVDKIDKKYAANNATATARYAKTAEAITTALDAAETVWTNLDNNYTAIKANCD